MARTLQLCDYFRIRLPRLLVLGFSDTLAIGKIRIDLLLVRQVECKRAMHFFQA